jgi:S1-C subfamily serine protease
MINLKNPALPAGHSGRSTPGAGMPFYSRPQTSTIYFEVVNLTELFDATEPCIVGFISRMASGNAESPPFPHIFGTGFIASRNGIVVTNRHVVDVFDQVPNHPRTRESSLAAIMWFPGEREADRHAWQMLTIDVNASNVLGEFTSIDEWFGNAVPDIGFVQLKVREIGCLDLASEDFYVKVGMPIATLGYPMGSLPLSVLGGRLHQLTPFIRQGIVSSVFPFPGARPHGFTIDIMQQGGSSGSPILNPENGKVVGMMSSGVLEWNTARSNVATLQYSQNTNISIAEPAHIIKLALEQVESGFPDASKFPTLKELRDAHPQDSGPEGLTWERWVPPST